MEGATSTEAISLNFPKATAANPTITKIRLASSSHPNTAQPPSIAVKVGIGVGASLGGLVIVILLSVFLVIWNKQKLRKQALPQRKRRSRYTQIRAPQTIPRFPPKNGIRVYQKTPRELASYSMPSSGRANHFRTDQLNPVELASCSTPNGPRGTCVRGYQRDPLESAPRSMPTSPKEIGSPPSPETRE